MNIKHFQRWLFLVVLYTSPISLFANTPKTVIVLPDISEKAYGIAGNIFQNYWSKITGQEVKIVKEKLGDYSLPSASNIILIGSDAVNPIVHRLIQDSVIDGLGMVYGADDYRLLSLAYKNKNILILAGGEGRSTIYAVYDFFRRRGGVNYFWDGDVFHKMHSEISIKGLNLTEKPHFQYRGLRYFAHRGLHRFEAEQWDLNDWKKEIDWVLKSRMNLFMLRTGIDNLFQLTFPDVPYPPINGPEPDAIPRSYNDRTSFWPLQYRGVLRQEVLKYARDRGLLNPIDCGTITHWYSPTPSSFYKDRPNFPVIKNQRTGYSLPSQAIWNIQDQAAWDAYWKLTKTMIRVFNDNAYPRLFHTIGMAERTFGTTHREDLQDKLFVYRKTIQMVHEEYPGVPILIAGWDLAGWEWTNQDVKRLLSELNPKTTILLDYTDDLTGRKTYMDWGTYKHFPWIFGILNSLNKNSDIHGDYNIYESRIKEASLDKKCIGLVLWPELSHSNTLLLQYVAWNSWNPIYLNIHTATLKYCLARYHKEIQNSMDTIWENFLPLSQKVNFGNDTGNTWNEPQFRILTSNTFTNFSKENIKGVKEAFDNQINGLDRSCKSLTGLESLSKNWYINNFWLRDALDISRTIASRALYESLALTTITLYKQKKGNDQKSQLKMLENCSKGIMGALANILSLSNDFSMYAGLERLYKAKPLDGIFPVVNSHSEYTLKGNAENNYCRSEEYELVEYVYRKELNLYWERVDQILANNEKNFTFDSEDLIKKHKVIIDDFYNTLLKDMRPELSRNPGSFSESLQSLKRGIDGLIAVYKSNSKNAGVRGK